MTTKPKGEHGFRARQVSARNTNKERKEFILKHTPAPETTSEVPGDTRKVDLAVNPMTILGDNTLLRWLGILGIQYMLLHTSARSPAPISTKTPIHGGELKMC